MEWSRDDQAGGGTYIRPLKYKCLLLKVQSASEERGKRGVSSERFRMAQRTRGSVAEDDWM